MIPGAFLAMFLAAVAPSDASANILTPPPGPAPRLTGPTIFGVRPGHPVVFRFTATGDRPMTFSASPLPPGLALDPASGILSGSVAKTGTYSLVVHASNARGESERNFRLSVGETISLTPPLGWNSWNCWAADVDQEKILASARAMANSGLADHGWSYINIDDTWEGHRGGPYHGILPNAKFPDMAGLGREIHSLGLKFGIYSTPWVTTYGGYNGGSADNPQGDWTRGPDKKAGWHVGRYHFERNDVAQWDAWGIDYLKYDWHPIDIDNARLMGQALRQGNRDIVFSLSNAAPLADAQHYMEVANLWRTGGDIRDEWRHQPEAFHYQSIADIWEYNPAWRRFSGPGHWNDPDMLVVGQVGWSKNLRPTHLTPDEQYTHITLWCLWSAPLLIGCPLERLDPFTLSLLTNDEVLDVDQDPLGRQAVLVAKDGLLEVWAKTLEDGTRAVGLFNRGETQESVRVTWNQLGLVGPQRVRDLWRQTEMGLHQGSYEAAVAPHGVVLVKVGRGSADLVPGQ